MTHDNSEALARSRFAWRVLLDRIKSVTPARLGRILLVLTAIGVLLWLIVLSWPALAPFVLGGAIAYALLPLVNVLDRFMPRALAVILTLVAVLALLGLFLAQFVPLIGTQVSVVYTSLPDQAELEELEVAILERLETMPAPVRSTIRTVLTTGIDTARSNLDTYVQNAVNNGLAGVFGLFNTIGFVLGFLVIPAWLLDILRDQKQGIEAAKRLVPDGTRGDIWAVVRLIDRPFRAFVQGQFVLAIAAGIGVYLGLSFLEMIGWQEFRYELLIAALVAFFQLIPTVGPIVAAIILFMLGLTRSPEVAVVALTLHIAVQAIVNNYVAPRIEQRYISIHPALLVMAIVALSEFGIIWVMLAAPITAVVRDLFRYAYGRISEPASPAGVLPGELNPIFADSTLFSPFVAKQRRRPLAYRRGGRIRRPSRTARQAANSTREIT